MAAALEELGHSAYICPLIEIVYTQAAPIVEDVDGTIITSRYGLRGLKECNALSSLIRKPVYVVGPATCALAADLGFTKIHQGPGSASGLAKMLGAELPSGTKLIHATSDNTAFDLEVALSPYGIAVRHEMVYRAVAAKSLTPDVSDAIRHGNIEGAILMSPRSAKIFGELVSEAGLVGVAQGLRFYCLSEAVSAALSEISPRHVEIARKPNLEALLALIPQDVTDAS